VTCPACGKLVAQRAGVGRPRKWCSERCRRRSWETVQGRAGACEDCGKAVGRTTTRCSDCARERFRVEREAKWSKFVELYTAGLSYRKIASALDFAHEQSLGVWVARQKRFYGLSVEPRRAQWRGHSKPTGRPSGYNGPPQSKDQARRRLQVAVRNGQVVRANACEDCGDREADLQAHHHDYSKPYDVTWLCAWCHCTRHGHQSFASGHDEDLIDRLRAHYEEVA
jgi:hypothetical protein